MAKPFTAGLLLSMTSAEPETRVNRALWAEAQGYESVWFGDGGGYMDAFTLAGAVAARTSRIRICLSIVPVFTRPPAVFATSAMTLSHLAPDRVVIGMGTSSNVMIEGWYGTPFHKPLTRVRETTQLLRRMLAGEKVDFQGETVSSRGFRLAMPVQGRVPIYLAALRPKMLELAGEIADGVILNFVPRDALPRLLEHVDKGAKRSGRRVEDLEIAQLVRTFVTRDVPRAENEFRGIAAAYFFTPVYNKYLAWCGYEKEAAQIAEGFRKKDRAMTQGAFGTELIHNLALIGTAAECRAELDKYRKAGLNTAVIECTTADRDDYLATIDAFTPAHMK